MPAAFALAVSAFFLKEPIAAGLEQRGAAHLGAWNLELARRELGAACRLSSRAGACLRLVHCHQLRGDHRAALEVLERAADRTDLQSELGAELLIRKAISVFSGGRPDEALRLLEQGQEIAAELGAESLLARAGVERARVLYYTRGAVDEARRELLAAREVGQELGAERLVADAMRQLGVVAWYSGELERALTEYYEPALETYRQLGDLYGEATTLSNIGLIHFFRGELFEFLRLQRRSLAIKERIGDRAGTADSLAYLSALYRQLGNTRKAFDYLSRSLELSRSIGYELGRNESEARLAQLARELGRLAEASTLLEELVRREADQPWLVKYRLADLGTIDLLRGEPERARRRFLRVLALDRASPTPEMEAATWINLAQTHLEEQQWRQAETALQHAAAHLARGGAEVQHLHATELALARSRLAAARGRRREALQHLLDAVAIDVELHDPEPGSGAVALGVRREVYERLLGHLFAEPAADAAAAGGAAAELAFAALETLRYRSFRNLVLATRQSYVAGATRGAPREDVEQRINRALRSRDPSEIRRAYLELEDTSLALLLDESEQQRVRAQRPAALDAVQAQLGADTALVEYLFAGDRVVALVVTSDRLRSVVLPVTVRQLRPKVRLFRKLVFDRDSGARWRTVAAELAERLWMPLERSGTLAGRRRVGIVPFAFLHDVPFAALVGTEGRLLVEEFVLFRLPSASFLVGARRSEDGSRAVSTEGSRLLSIGYDGAPGEGPRLEHAEAEARAIAALAGGEALTGERATKSVFFERAAKASLVHMAVHGVSEPQLPLLSRLRLAPDGESTGYLSLTEVVRLPMRARLVTLSACRTARSGSLSGRPEAEFDRVGLIEAFLFAGAGAVLATLEPIGDRVAAELMGSLYRGPVLSDPPLALAEMQRAALRRRDGGAHPAHWAGFVVVGIAF